jgi:hypothetical protein
MYGGTGPVKFNRRPSVHPDASLLQAQTPTNTEFRVDSSHSRPQSMPLFTREPDIASSHVDANAKSVVLPEQMLSEHEVHSAASAGTRLARAASAPEGVQYTHDTLQLHSTAESSDSHAADGAAADEDANENATFAEDADKILFSPQEILALKLMFSLFDRFVQICLEHYVFH